MRGAVAGVVLALCLACTQAPGGTPGAGQEPKSSVARPSSDPVGSATESDPPTVEPLVLAVHATTPVARLRMTSAEARRLLAGGRTRWRVRAAPGLAVGDSVEVVGSASAAVRAATRDSRVLAVVPARSIGPQVQPIRVDGVHPLRRPAAYPLTVAGPEPAAVVTLSVTGDIMLGRGVPDPAAALAGVGDRLRSADLTVGNLESTLSDAGDPQQPGDDSFYAPPSVVPLLADAGFDALSLANNHTGDYERRALLQTVRLLRSSTVEPFGAGGDLARAAEPAVLEADDVRFGFLGFNAIGETARATRTSAGALSLRMPPRTGPLNRADLRYLERRVRELDQRVDVVVVLPHWGGQYTHRPEPVQRRVARRLVAAGADLVVGGHPHWVQGLDLVAGTAVAHSLGNFVFDMDFMRETMEGVLLEATFWGAELKAVDLVPYRMDARFVPHVVRGRQARAILGDIWSTSTGPFAR